MRRRVGDITSETGAVREGWQTLASTYIKTFVELNSPLPVRMVWVAFLEQISSPAHSVCGPTRETPSASTLLCCA